MFQKLITQTLTFLLTIQKTVLNKTIFVRNDPGGVANFRFYGSHKTGNVNDKTSYLFSNISQAHKLDEIVL